MATHTFTVATGKYVAFFERLAVDCDRFLNPESALRMTVFTDQAERARRLQASLKRVELDVVVTRPLSWPDATIMRYELIAEAISNSDADLCLHLDADLRLVRDLNVEGLCSSWTNGLAFVRHHGFDTASIPLQLKPVALVRRILEGGYGQWETSATSQAFVPRDLRKSYVCGGVWMGLRKPFEDLCVVLAQRTRIDRDHSVIARWHDESHLNWFFANKSGTLLPSFYCWDQRRRPYPQEVSFVAVDKGGSWIR